MISITTIDEESPYLKRVIALGDANSKTLGFLTEGAFIDFVRKKLVFIAEDKKENFLGYLLYNTNRKGQVYIVHLCVNPSHRHKGIARQLVKGLKEATKDSFRGIRVHCRRDFIKENKVWEKLGFDAIGEKEGRSKHKKTTLTIRWFDYGHPTLFTLAEKQQDSSRLKVVIDANIFFDLKDSPQTATEKESQSLLADWLNIELWLTKEIFNEVDRRENEVERQQNRNIAHNFNILHIASDDDTLQRTCEQLRPFFGKQMSDSDESDLRQLAHSIVSDIQFFVTYDEALQRKSEKIHEHFGIHVIAPSFLITHQDELMRESEYQPIKLAGQIEIKRIHSQQIPFLEDIFFAHQKNESKAEFKRKLQSFLIEPHIFETQVIQDKAGQPLALTVYCNEDQYELEVPIFRLVQRSLSATLNRHLIFKMVSDSLKKGKELTKITDPYLSEESIESLQENGFAYIEDYWIKANLSVISESKKFISVLHTRKKENNHFFDDVVEIFKKAYTSGNLKKILEIERFLWPAKIIDIDIPHFVVSIYPEYAMHLFDAEIASQDIVGAEQRLIWNVENVYYLHPRKMLSAPARVLWYVGQGSGNYQGTMSIRACSYIDEVIIGKPKDLYSRFKRLGVYEWKAVFKIAKNDINQEIMAFRFSRTETFKSPIHREELDRIWQEENGKNFHIQAPISITSQLFFKIYKIGTHNV
jgi:GNAT superfamily N-acetyltransferase